MDAPDDRRAYVRKSLKSTVSVFDRDSNQYIGLVADYSDEGLLITSSITPIQVGKIYHFMLLVQSSHGMDDTDRASVDAVSVWCERTSPSFYGTGFKLQLLPSQAKKLLESCSNE